VYIESSGSGSGSSAGASDDLPVEHLQLRPGVNRVLREWGVTSVGAAAEFNRSSKLAGFPYRAELNESIAALEQSRVDGQVEWPRYWALRGWRLHHLAAFLAPLQRLSSHAREIPVDRTTFGNAGAMLQASGITTLGVLVDSLARGIGNIRGLGRGKLTDLFRSLVRLCGEMDESGDIRRAVERQAAKSPLIWPDLAPGVRDLPLSILHIGQKSTWLVRAGYTTVGRVLDAGPEQLGGLDAVGPRTVRVITGRIQQLAACSEGGELDLPRYCAASGLILIPEEAVSSGQELLQALPPVISALGEHLPDDVYRMILTERLSKAPREQQTLEAIAQQSVPPITRERVRQKEKKLLTQLAASLIWSRDNELGIHFHPSFTALWKAAAFEFSGVEEIGFDEFITRLGRVWDVRPAELTPHLPIILALVTGEPQMPVAFRAGLRLDARLLEDLPQRTLDLPLRRLRIGRQCDRLEAGGATCLRDALTLGKSGGLPEKVVKHLNLFAEALTPDGRIDWSRYAGTLCLQCIPSEPPRNPEEFAGGFVAVIGQILRRTSTERRVRIFELRTSLPVGARRTLQAVADIVGAHAPTIKREESELLHHLHDVLVDRDFTSLDLWINEDWLRWVREAVGVFSLSGMEYDKFEASLALRWALRPSLLQPALPSLWAIFTGYPQGGRRRRALRKSTFESSVAIEATRIRLTGFRRLH
jgi:hypothetical protein